MKNIILLLTLLLTSCNSDIVNCMTTAKKDILKFSFGDTVFVTGGFHKGRVGTVKEYNKRRYGDEYQITSNLSKWDIFWVKPENLKLLKKDKQP